MQTSLYTKYIISEGSSSPGYVSEKVYKTFVRSNELRLSVAVSNKYTYQVLLVIY